MSSSTNTACSGLKVRLGLLVTLCLLGAGFAQDANLRVPASAAAGEPLSIPTTGSGTATFYLIGPAQVLKQDVELGKDISLSAKETQQAGRYVAMICGNDCASVSFFVTPAKPVDLTLLVHPSRAPVAQSDVISGVAFPFDEFGNLNLAPQTVQFQLSSNSKEPGAVRSVTTHDGVAWFRTNSGKSAGVVQVSASLNGSNARRVVQQVASDPCSLRIKGQRTSKGVMVETEPVRDCSGNPVPDGTVVTFTAKNGNEISTVDAPVKQDVARARITATGPVVISAASGVVMGNELRLGGEQR